MLERRVGTAGWTIPAAVRERFAGAGSLLERYARVFTCVEINSTFYKPHRDSTYLHWADSVPADFRFALKLPKEITHERRFVDIAAPLEQFLTSTAALGSKRDVLLVQLPPSFAYDERLAEAFFERLRAGYAGRIACEPRHAGWFSTAANALLVAFGVVRVDADPPAAGAIAAAVGGDFRYVRLHGSPQMYYSSYDAQRLAALAGSLRSASVPVWCIFDNTARGAATANALTLLDALHTGS